MSLIFLTLIGTSGCPPNREDTNYEDERLESSFTVKSIQMSRETVGEEYSDLVNETAAKKVQNVSELLTKVTKFLYTCIPSGSSEAKLLANINL